MKTRLLSIACGVLIGAIGAFPACAYDDSSSMVVAADVLVARPACLAATIVGSAVFVVSLPVALLSKSTNKAAKVLVVGPAKATFTRPLGDFDNLDD